jgi:hypothetical protein
LCACACVKRHCACICRQAREPTACMMWRRLTRAYVGVGAGVGVDVGAGEGVDVGEAVGVGVVGATVGVDVVGVAVLHPTTSCKTKAVRGLFSKPKRARCRFDHRQATKQTECLGARLFGAAVLGTAVRHPPNRSRHRRCNQPTRYACIHARAQAGARTGPRSGRRRLGAARSRCPAQ